jgi:chromosome segregation ATPase
VLIAIRQLFSFSAIPPSSLRASAVIDRWRHRQADISSTLLTMADKFANLAGYHGEETTYDATVFRSSTDGRAAGGLSELDESDDGIAPVQPLQQRFVNANNGSRSNTPVNRHAKESSDQTTPKLASRKRGTLASAGSSSRNGGTRRQEIAAVIRNGGSDVEDSFEDSEVELQKIRRDVTTGQDTTMGGDTMANDESGFAGARHVIGRRSAAGISLKDSEARIKKLEAENNDLRIECDLWRTQMKPDEARLQVVTISKELARNRKSNVDLMRLLKEQDSSIKESKRILKRWGNLDPKEEQRKRKELEEEVRQAREQAEVDREARLKAEEELDMMLKSGGDRDSQLRQLLEEEREDHADALYAVEKERDAIQAQLDEALEASRSAPVKEEIRQMEDDLMELEQHIKTKEAENGHLTRKLEEFQQIRSNHETELEKLRAQVTESQAAEDSFSRELEVANRRLEHLTSDQQDEMLRIREAEDAVAEQLGIQIDQLRDEAAEAKLELQNKMEYIETLEAQRDDDDVRFEEMELELERATRALEEKVEEINTLNDELDELDMICQRAKQDAQEADEEAKKLNEVVKLKEDDLVETNKELQKISQALFTTEEENEAIKQEANGLDEEIRQLSSQLEETRERSERKERAYKDRLQQAEQIKGEIQSQLEAIGKEYANAAEDSNVLGRDVDSLHQEKRDLKMELEKVYEKLDDAVADLKEEEKRREVLEDELEAKLDEQEDRYKRVLAEREESMATLERQLASMEESLSNSKGDVEKLQGALRNKENESQRLGQSHSHDLHSMELEIDRLKRDLSRCEAELDRARQDLDRRDTSIREKDGQIDKLHVENRNVSSKLAAEIQDAKSLREKLESHRKTVQEAQQELQQTRNKAAGLEHELNKGEKTMMQAEQAVKNQLTERNTLLLTIYQYMGKILGNEKVKTGKRGAEADLKPFTDFAVFNDSLIARMRRVSDIQTQFEQRAKMIEDQFAEKLTAFKRLQDGRFRQIDRFEVAIKNAIDKQGQWRSRVVAKQTEVDAVKATNAELQAQLASLKTRSLLSSPGEGSKLTALTSRANNAERRLNAAQTQATMAEERLIEAKSKYGEGEGKWAARIKELESRNKAAEERVKRERQGAKERVTELIEQVRRLEKELDGATKRNRLLDEVKATQ